MLNRVEMGKDGELAPLLIVHGLYGSARNWGAIQRRLAADRRVIAVDMRNHGESPRADSQTYADMAADLAEVIAAEGRPMDVIGHSMGGKAAMVLALTHPGTVNRLLVADIAPVPYAHGDLNAGYARAMRALDLGAVTTRSEADRLLAPGVPDPGTRAFLLQSLDLKATPPHWRLNLDVLERDMDAITGFPELAGQFGGPALFLTGQMSTYVRPEHRERIKALFPKAIFARLPGAGHWLHADAPRPFEEAARAFFR